MVRYYKHEQSFRSPLTVTVTVFILGMFWFSMTQGAPQFLLWFFGLIAALLLWQVLRNPISGIDVQPTHLRAYSGNWEQRANLKDIKSIQIKRDSDGPDSFTLFLHSGKKRPIPYVCIGNTDAFEKALKSLGVDID